MLPRLQPDQDVQDNQRRAARDEEEAEERGAELGPEGADVLVIYGAEVSLDFWTLCVFLLTPMDHCIRNGQEMGKDDHDEANDFRLGNAHLFFEWSTYFSIPKNEKVDLHKYE